MPAKIGIDALKIFQNQKQMRLNTGKKLKTASLNSQFTGSKKEECSSTCSILKLKDLKLLLIYQLPQWRFTSFKNIIVWKKLLLFHIDPKIFCRLFTNYYQLRTVALLRGGRGAARPGCHHFEVTLFYDTKQRKKKQQNV